MRRGVSENRIGPTKGNALILRGFRHANAFATLCQKNVGVGVMFQQTKPQTLYRSGLYRVGGIGLENHSETREICCKGLLVTPNATLFESSAGKNLKFPLSVELGREMMI